MCIVTKAVGELKEHHFYVPSYQRGYRWTEHEAIALLEDINEFSVEGGKRYCIQPLIVKQHSDGKFEVVDGQQRLTTLYIFMKIASQEIRSATPPFKLEYETRENSAKFLESLSESLSDNTQLEQRENIDFYHMANVYKGMNQWLDNQPDKSVAIQELNTKIRKSVFFIWYEIPKNSDAIAIFTKVNLGKIRLTNAELIKALVLNKDNFNSDINRKQIEISVAWDRIEQGLRDDSFWYFLNEKEKSGTRIDMIFELLAYEQNSKLPNPIHKEQSYFSFLVFSQALKLETDKEKFVKQLWSEVERLYAEFIDWYTDLNKYHIIGYLIASGVKISDIFKLTRGKRKSEVMRALIEKAKGVTADYDLSNIFYDRANNRPKIRKLLLLFNIATLVCKSEKQYRFPFHIYKGETEERVKWDIEHIHATADNTDEADDSIGNLTLLDAQTNRSYQDQPFEYKRKVILEREANGLFVPLCTKNVFLKVYSKNVKNMNAWESDDKKDYVEAMNGIFNLFFNGGFLK